MPRIRPSVADLMQMPGARARRGADGKDVVFYVVGQPAAPAAEASPAPAAAMRQMRTEVRVVVLRVTEESVQCLAQWDDGELRLPGAEIRDGDCPEQSAGRALQALGLDGGAAQLSCRFSWEDAEPAVTVGCVRFLGDEGPPVSGGAFWAALDDAYAALDLPGAELLDEALASGRPDADTGDDGVPGSDPRFGF